MESENIKPLSTGEKRLKSFVLTDDFSSDEDIENFTIEEIRFEDDV